MPIFYDINEVYNNPSMLNYNSIRQLHLLNSNEDETFDNNQLRIIKNLQMDQQFNNNKRGIMRLGKRSPIRLGKK